LPIRRFQVFPVWNLEDMTTVTPDAIRVLAQASGEDVVLAIKDGEIRVIEAAQAHGDPAVSQVLYSQAKLLAEYGEEVTDAEAITLAAGLTASIAH
jgi:hypothetical protein